MIECANWKHRRRSTGVFHRCASGPSGAAPRLSPSRETSMRGGNRVQMGLTYAASLLSFAVDGAPRPFSAAFNVTDRCNLRCEYCNFSSFAGPELDVPHIAVLFDRLHGMGVRRLGVVGGEPLVRKDIGEILCLARRRGFFISVSTNL